MNKICFLLIFIVILCGCKNHTVRATHSSENKYQIGFVQFELPVVYKVNYEDTFYKQNGIIKKAGNAIVSFSSGGELNNIDNKEMFKKPSLVFFGDTVAHFSRLIYYYKGIEGYMFQAVIYDLNRMPSSHTFLDSLGGHCLYLLAVGSLSCCDISLDDCKDLFNAFTHCIIDTAGIAKSETASMKNMDSLNKAIPYNTSKQ